MGKQWQILFSWAPKSPWVITAATKLKEAYSFKKQRYHFAGKGLYSQSYGVSSSHIEVWKLDHKEDRAMKNWCFLVVGAGEDYRLDCKEIQPVNPKWNQSWGFIGRTDTENQYFGHLMQRADSLEKTLMLGKIEGKRRRGWQGKKE